MLLLFLLLFLFSLLFLLSLLFAKLACFNACLVAGWLAGWACFVSCFFLLVGSVLLGSGPVRSGQVGSALSDCFLFESLNGIAVQN